MHSNSSMSRFFSHQLGQVCQVSIFEIWNLKLSYFAHLFFVLKAAKTSKRFKAGYILHSACLILIQPKATKMKTKLYICYCQLQSVNSTVFSKI